MNPSFAQLFEPSPAKAAQYVLVDPKTIAKGKAPAEAKAWQLLLGSIALRRAGELSAANDWLNNASLSQIEDDIFKAELLGEAGQGLYASDRHADAAEILNSATAIWRALCAEAAAASGQEAASAFASRLLPPFGASNVKPPVSASDIRSGKGAGMFITMWLEGRAAVARPEAFATLLRLLARMGRFPDAKRLCDEELAWLDAAFAVPSRRGRYALLLAKGEIDLAAGEFEASARSFENAANVYHKNTLDESDVQRLLQAKFNQANSLLRLDRFDEVLDIYALCEHGFRSIGAEAAANRVAQAKLFARSRQEDKVDS